VRNVNEAVTKIENKSKQSSACRMVLTATESTT